MKKQVLTGLMGAAMLSLCVGSAFAAEAQDTQEPILIAPAPSAYTVTVNGKTLTEDKSVVPEAPYTENGRVMVPLRATAEALGEKVTWLPADRSIRVEGDALTMTVQVGLDSYASTSKEAIGMTAPQTYGAAPVIKGDRTYVPAQMFELLDCTVTVSNGTVALQTGTQQMPNPLVEYDTLPQAAKAVSFQVKVPGALKVNDQTTIVVINNQLVELFYDGDSMLYRVAAAGEKDISGDYNQYQNTQTLTVGAWTVTAKDNGNGILLATWSDQENSYSISFQTGVTAQTLHTILTSIAAIH